MRVCYASLHSAADAALLGDVAEDFHALGFDGLALGVHMEGEAARGAIQTAARAASAAGLPVMLDLLLERPEQIGAANIPDAWFIGDPIGSPPPDPRSNRTVARFQWGEQVVADEIARWWGAELAQLARQGVGGFRCLSPNIPPPSVWRTISAATCDSGSPIGFYAWTAGLPWERIAALREAGFSGGFLSSAWWDGRAPWLAGEAELIAQLGAALSIVDAPAGHGLAPTMLDRDSSADAAMRKRSLLRALSLASCLGDGLFAPISILGGDDDALNEDARSRWFGAGSDGDIRAAIIAANERAAAVAGLSPPRFAGFSGDVSILLRADSLAHGLATKGAAILINQDDSQTAAPSAMTLAGCGSFIPAQEADRSAPPLAPSEVRLVPLIATRPVSVKKPRTAVDRFLQAPRIAIERITGDIDNGRFAAKRIVGQPVIIEADIFSDGHDKIAAEVLWRPADERPWRRSPMAPLGNDRWRGTFIPDRIGRHLITVEAWQDSFASFQHALHSKMRAKVDVSVELEEARQLVSVAQTRRPDPDLARLLGLLEQKDQQGADAALSPQVTKAMAERDARRFLTQREPPIPLEIEREQAGFASWYELFPRSVTDNSARHGTLRDVIGRLPAIRAMGFDVLYFPPIHPIGRKNRKGRNNSLTAATEDVGSPYAIGAAEGGHDAILTELGDLDDFRALVRAAERQGIEIALDFAIQCSPDHPWLAQHPGWFQRRPDGSIRYAENPPKKYEDIVNVDFYAPDATPALWIALRDVVRFWIDQGVRMFRVDNPHTKPLPFWEWMIADIRSARPDIIFLSEAFTRPKMMYRLAKLGFSQSYTYFTWRNTKPELTAYIEELVTTAPRDYFRPHFFVNTPDINPIYLQISGRPGFVIRAALAATLSGLWGLYSGFEMCEATPLPGREEYLNSEKYEIRARDYASPGNIVSEITALNNLRRAYPALQTHLNTRFYNAFNDAIIYYGKGDPAADEMLLVLINLDPHAAHECDFEIPLWEWGLSDNASVEVENLWRGGRFIWRGKVQHIRLDPLDSPVAIFRIAPRAGIAA